MWILLVAFIIGLSVTIACDYLGSKKKISDELSRKLPHLAVALLYGALPFFVDIKFVTYGAILQLILAPIAVKLSLFHHARRIDRKSWGEFTFPAGVLIASMLTNHKWVFAAAMLNLGIADTVAAIVGKKYGHKNSYKIVGQMKSLAGSLAFYVCSLLITVLVLNQLGVGYAYWQTIIWLPALLSVAEATGVYGIDNFTIPILTTLVLGSYFIV